MERIAIKTIVAGFVITLFCWTAVAGQSPIFEKKVRPFPENPDFGPNRRNFIHPVVQLHAGVPPILQKSDVPAYPSAGISGGFRYKLKINPLLAIGAESGISYDYRRKQFTGSSGQPDTLSWGRESYRSLEAYTSGFIRIKTPKSGDYLGRFVDIGICCSFPVLANQVTFVPGMRNNTSTMPSVIIKRQRVSTMPLCEWGGVMRIGNNRTSMTVTYRQSQLMPRLIIGIEYAVMRY